MRSLALSSILCFFVNVICFAQSPEQKLSQSLQQLSTTLQPTTPGLLGSGLGSTALPVDGTNAPTPSTSPASVIAATKQSIKNGITTLEIVYSVADAYATLGKNMRMLPDTESVKVNLAVGKLDKKLKLGTTVLASAGTAYSLYQLIGKTTVGPKTALTVNLASLVPLLVTSITSSGNKQIGANNTSIETAIRKGIKSLLRKADGSQSIPSLV